MGNFLVGLVKGINFIIVFLFVNGGRKFFKRFIVFRVGN